MPKQWVAKLPLLSPGFHGGSRRKKTFGSRSRRWRRWWRWWIWPHVSWNAVKLGQDEMRTSLHHRFLSVMSWLDLICLIVPDSGFLLTLEGSMNDYSNQPQLWRFFHWLVPLCPSKSSLCAMPWLILWTKFPSTDETGCAMVLSFKDYMIVCAKWALYQ